MNQKLMELEDAFKDYVLPEFKDFLSSCVGEDVIDPKAPDEAKQAWEEYCQIIKDAEERGVDF